MDSQQTQQIIQQQKKMSLLARGIITHILIVFAFSLIYTIYTLVVGDDFSLKREHWFDTGVSALFLSSFVSAGSFPSNMTHSSSFSRLILTTNVLLSSFSMIWTICTETI